MGKRQFRIPRKDILQKQSEILGKQGHVILSAHVVHNGTIQEISDTHLTLVDPRFGKHRLEIKAIEEVVYDKETEY